MKKRITALLLLLTLSVTSLFACTSADKSESASDKTAKTSKSTSTKKQELTPVTLNEVAHSIFYAPMYVAIEKGYFSNEGIDLSLVTGFGADKTMTAVLSGTADIGFMGSEASIYTYNEGANDYVVNFAQLTQRAGNFLVAREDIKDFKWEDLKGKKVIGGRKGGMPEMVFEYILNQNHIDPATDLTIDQNIDFGSTAAAFAEDKSDYDFTVEFEPGATNLEKQGKGYVVASLGTDSGYVPYTAFSAKKSYINKHPEVVQGFTNALQKGMDYVASHTPEDIAQAIAPQFKETTLDTITTIISRYYEQDTWKKDLIFRQESFDLLQDILEEAGELKERAPYKDLVTTTYAEKAAKTSNDTQKTNYLYTPISTKPATSLAYYGIKNNAANFSSFCSIIFKLSYIRKNLLSAVFFFFLYSPIPAPHPGALSHNR